MSAENQIRSTRIQERIEQVVTYGMGYDRVNPGDIFLADNKEVNAKRGHTDDLEVQLRLGKLDVLTSGAMSLLGSITHPHYFDLQNMYSDLATIGVVEHVVFHKPEEIIPLLPKHKEWKTRVIKQQYLSGSRKVNGLGVGTYSTSFDGIHFIRAEGVGAIFDMEPMTDPFRRKYFTYELREAFSRPPQSRYR